MSFSSSAYTTAGFNGTTIATHTVSKAIEIKQGDDSIVAFNTDGTITSPAGAITVEDWIETVQLMKQLIVDIAQDPELAARFPYLEAAAHRWMITTLRK
jgi:hypothetical protein